MGDWRTVFLTAVAPFSPSCGLAQRTVPPLQCGCVMLVQMKSQGGERHVKAYG